jgi:adenine-specific DNA-methyltransferase
MQPGYSVPLKPEFLKAHPTLMVDTRHFDHGFTASLLEGLDDLDGQIDGELFHGENFQALSLMQERYRKQVSCVYIDPPYNSKTSEIAYKNTYKHSSWITMMENRLTLSSMLSTEVGSHVVAIDENEQEVLGQLMSLVFPTHEKICVSVIHNKKGIQGDYLSHNHEYAFFSIPHALPKTHGAPVPQSDWEYTNLRKWGRESERSTARNCFYPIFVERGEIVGFGEVCDEGYHPSGSNVVEGPRTSVFPVDGAGVERKWRYARNSVEAIRHLLKVHVTTGGDVQIVKAVDEKPIKTVWDDSRYIAGDYGTKWLTDLGVKVRDDLYPKSVHLVEDSIHAVTEKDSRVLDYFAGSGTTGHAVINVNRRDAGKRRFVLVEMGDYFDTVLLPRIKKITFSPEWRDGKPRRLATPQEAERSPRVVKVIRLESYEDALNNLEVRRTDEQQLVLGTSEAQGAGGLREQYLLRYMLDVETRGSQSLLNVQAFTDPTAYKLKVKRAGSDESREVNVDLLETFNWLIGLSVRRIGAPQTFRAAFERDKENRLCLKGHLQQDVNGPYWFRAVNGTAPDGRKVLIIWRKTTDDPEKDNVVLDAWFTKQGHAAKGGGFELILVNGGNNLENLRASNDSWKVRLLEEVFHRRMHGGEGDR